MLAAMRRASSRVRSAPPLDVQLFLEIDVSERLTIGVADDEAGVVHLVERPRRREAARRGHWRDISGRANVSDIDLSSCRYVTAASVAPVHSVQEGPRRPLQVARIAKRAPAATLGRRWAPGGVFPARMAVEAPCPARRRSIITNCCSDLLDLSLRSALDQPDLANGETGGKMERFNRIDPTDIARARRALGVQKKRHVP